VLGDLGFGEVDGLSKNGKLSALPFGRVFDPDKRDPKANSGSGRRQSLHAGGWRLGRLLDEGARSWALAACNAFSSQCFHSSWKAANSGACLTVYTDDLRAG
jgi:hypothetical protein